jgi:hypothetical protein
VPSAADDRDLEAAKVVDDEDTIRPYEYNNDEAVHPRLPSLNTNLALVDFMCLWVGWLFHTVLLYWTFSTSCSRSSTA